MSRRGAALLGLLLAAVLGVQLAGCGEAAARPAFPKDNAVPGWTQGPRETFAGDALAGLGSAAVQYGVESAERQEYHKASGEQIEVQVWRMSAPAEAYGVWTALRSGSRVEQVGNDADSDGVRRLGFWQESYFVQVLAGQDASAQDLEGFGAAVAKALPKGGQVPALIQRLPKQGLNAESPIYFHDEAVIEEKLALGGENILGLNPEVPAALAAYTIDGQTYQLLLVEYPQAEDAAAHLPALQNVGLPGLLVSGGKGGRLGAVFGKESSSGVVELLHEALTP